MSRRLAFLWGSNANKHYPTLKYAKRDVDRLRHTLSSKRYGFEVTTPSDGSGPHQIHEAIIDAASSCDPDDVFIGYFSGHGQLIGSKLYLVLDKSMPGETRTMFSSTWLIDVFRGCRARNRLLILDCCHAGAATGIKGPGVDVTELFPDHRDERVLYASGKLESAKESEEFEGSFFTRMLCESLVAAPPGSVTLSQVVDALQRAALARNQQAPLQHQVPVPYLSGSQRDDFHFASPTEQQDRSHSRRILIDKSWPAPKVRRHHAFKNIIPALRTGLRAAASDGQGAYFVAMLAFGLAAFLFHGSRQAHNEEHDFLRDNSGRALAELLLPDEKTSVCATPLISSELHRALDSAYDVFWTQYPKWPFYETIRRCLNNSSHETIDQPSTVTNSGSSHIYPTPGGYYRLDQLYHTSTENSEGSVRNTVQCPNRENSTLTRATTLPYFDPAGNGVVETICYEGKSPTKDVLHNEAHEQFCATIALSEQVAVAGLLPASAAFDISIIRIPNSSQFAAETISKQGAHSWLYDERLSRIADKEARSQASKYYDKILQHKPESHKANDTGGVLKLDGERLEDQIFGVSVFHQPARGNLPEYWDVAIMKLRPKGMGASSYALLSLCTMSLIFGVGILVLSFQRKLRRQQSLLSRGLQYGLLELSDGKIIGANDRAEEILRTKLPRLGIHSARVESGKTFAPMINDTCILLPTHGGPPSESDICSYDGKIRDRATDGLTSVFYAWVTQVEVWIKVTSTIILLPSGTEHVVCALDTAIDRQYEVLLATVRSRFNEHEVE